MLDSTLALLLLALVLDWYLGEPSFLWSRLPHPVVLFGKAVSWIDRSLNRDGDSDREKYRKGAIGISGLILVTLVAGSMLDGFLELFGIFGFAFEVLLVFTLLAQKSLYEHVQAVSTALREDGLEGGRTAVGNIVGRDPSQLDHSGVCRASIESLSENFSDGVVAPAFWYLVFGLPGILAYKMINTADSMIGYRSEQYEWFGRVAAQIDDLANWLPARFSAVLIAIGCGMSKGLEAIRYSLICALRDSGLHRSPNAGWPEAAMAGGIGVALGGPRRYAEETVGQAFINAGGKRKLDYRDINTALDCFVLACFVLWALVAVLWLVF